MLPELETSSLPTSPTEARAISFGKTSKPAPEATLAKSRDKMGVCYMLPAPRHHSPFHPAKLHLLNPWMSGLAKPGMAHPGWCLHPPFLHLEVLSFTQKWETERWWAGLPLPLHLSLSKAAMVLSGATLPCPGAA